MNQQNGRTDQVTKNVMSSFAAQVITMLLSFLTRTVFIKVLSSEFLGIGSLFSSILTVLSLSELGISSAIMYALYKPLADHDEKTISSLMEFYHRAYKLIGLTVLLIGMTLLPFLGYLVKDNSTPVNIRIIFSLYVAESVSTYWVLAYKQTLLEADQKKYRITNVNTIISSTTFVLRIILLVLLRHKPTVAFYAYLVVGIIDKIIAQILVARIVDKTYPMLKTKKVEKLTAAQRRPIFQNVAGVFISKISGIMLTSTDNILISAFINIASVGRYSNYLAVRSYVVKPIGIIFDSMTASVGNYCATESIEKQESFFNTIQFAYFWIYGFCGISLWILLNPFIGGIWLGHDYLLSGTAVSLIVLNFLLDGLAGAVVKFRTANGLYWQAKYRYLFSAIFNGVVSYLLVKPFGIEGVLLGTTASILIMISFDPIIVFRHIFKKSPFKYYLSYLNYLLLTIATGTVVHLFTIPFSKYTLPNFIIKVFLCVIIPNGLWGLIFKNTQQMDSLVKYGKAFIGRAKKKTGEIK